VGVNICFISITHTRPSGERPARVAWRPISSTGVPFTEVLRGCGVDDKKPLPPDARPVGWIGLVRHSKGETGFSSSPHDLSSDTRLAFDFVCWVVLIELAVSDSCQKLEGMSYDLRGIVGKVFENHAPRSSRRAFVCRGGDDMTFPHSILHVGFRRR